MKSWILFLLFIPIDVFAESRDSLLLKDSMTFTTSPLEASLELSTKYVWRGKYLIRREILMHI